MIELVLEKNSYFTVKKLIWELVPIILEYGIIMKMNIIGELTTKIYTKVNMVVILLLMTLISFNGLVW